MIDLYEKGKAKFDWWQDWRDECVAIVGGGPSAKTSGVEKLKNRIHVIAVNESYQLCPWAEVLYSCDGAWWQLRHSKINGFAGLKLCFDAPRGDPPQKINKIVVAKHGDDKYVNDFLFSDPGVVGSGGHSGFQMINLSAQFGATGIMLVGFDMDSGSGIHWHGQHPVPLRNPDDLRLKEWRKVLDANAPRLQTKWN